LANSSPARGVFVLYSAGAGQTALDRLGKNDSNRNSVFTRVFIEQLAKRGIHLGELAVEVREKVAEIALTARNDSGENVPHEQTPAHYAQTIGGRVFLAGRVVEAEPAPRPQPVPPAPPALSADEVFWLTIKSSTAPALFEEFLKNFPASPRAAEARKRLDEV